MRMKRVLGAATAAALLMTGPLAATAPAQEAETEVETGVGSGLVSSTLLGIDIGNLLNLDLLDDESLSTIDPANGEPVSSAVFNPLSITSSVLGPLSLGSVATSSTGAEDTKTVTKDPVAGNIPVPIVSGLLEGSLSSIVDGEGARSSLLAGIGDLDLVGGLLGLGSSSDAVTFTSSAAAADAGGVRTLDIPSLELLNLGNLLAGIGLPLGDLPLTDLVGLLDGLGIESVPVVGAPGGTMPTDDVISTVTDLVSTLEVLDALPAKSLTDPLSSDTCNALPVVGSLLGSVLCDGGDCNDSSLPVVGDVTSLVGEPGSLVANIVGLLEPILGGALPVLDDLNLLEVGGLTASMQATATDSVDSSVADVVANISSLKVAELDVLEDLDLTQGLDVLAGVSDTVSGLLNSGLGIDGLLDIDVLEITELIQPDGDYTNALSGLTMLGVNLDPSKILGVGILQADREPTASSILGDGLPLLGGDMLALDGILSGVTSILTEGLGIEVGTMESEGFFTPLAALPPGLVPPAAQPVTPPADGTLPRTGADSALPAAMAALLLGAAFGVRRLVRTEPLRSEPLRSEKVEI
ncbi:hypothetical protein BH23ACT1_BH23ACT1_06760 [soil metagenome]